MPQVTLTYTFANELEAAAFLNQRVPAEKGKPDPKPALKADPAASSPTAASTPSPTPAAHAAQPAADPKPVAYADSGLPALIKDAVGRDREGVIALLKKFGAAKGDQLKPDQFDAFKAEIVKVGAADLA